jgi:hypothetical protein
MTNKANEPQAKSSEPQKPQKTQRLYSKSHRGGKIFEGAEIDKAIKDGWVNHPDKIK